MKHFMVTFYLSDNCTEQRNSKMRNTETSLNPFSYSLLSILPKILYCKKCLVYISAFILTANIFRNVASIIRAGGFGRLGKMVLCKQTGVPNRLHTIVSLLKITAKDEMKTKLK